MSSIYTGALIAESLQPAAALEGFPLTVTKIYRAELGNADAGQPELWTVIEFAVAADHAPELAKTLSRMLGKQGGWYCDFHSDQEVFVVFAEQIFRYPYGDQAGRARAAEHGRSVGSRKPSSTGQAEPRKCDPRTTRRAPRDQRSPLWQISAGL
jgi:hypothetical protein